MLAVQDAPMRAHAQDKVVVLGMQVKVKGHAMQRALLRTAQQQIARPRKHAQRHLDVRGVLRMMLTVAVAKHDKFAHQEAHNVFTIKFE